MSIQPVRILVGDVMEGLLRSLRGCILARKTVDVAALVVKEVAPIHVPIREGSVGDRTWRSMRVWEVAIPSDLRAVSRAIALQMPKRENEKRLAALDAEKPRQCAKRGFGGTVGDLPNPQLTTASHLRPLSSERPTEHLMQQTNRWFVCHLHHDPCVVSGGGSSLALVRRRTLDPNMTFTVDDASEVRERKHIVL